MFKKTFELIVPGCWFRWGKKPTVTYLPFNGQPQELVLISVANCQVRVENKFPAAYKVSCEPLERPLALF